MANTNTITPPENASASSDFRPTFASKLFDCLLYCAFAFRACLPFFFHDNAYAPSSSSNPQENLPSSSTPLEINAAARSSSSIPHGNAPSYFSTPSKYATAPCSSYTSSNFSTVCPVPTSYPDYDVFINHRGPDVKAGFATDLYSSLDSFGWRVFLDKPEMQGGLGMNSQIKHAIETASIHIAIFSPRYAESSWCLDELHQMLKTCESDVAILIPVFYLVTPSQVRWTDKGPYGEALLSHRNKNRYDSKKIHDWKDALSQAAERSGFELEACNGDHKMLLDQVVGRVLEIGKRTPFKYVAKPEFQKTVLLRLHQPRSKAIVVGIAGPGGIGKTELAQDLFKNKGPEYRSCWLSVVKESSRISLLRTVIEGLTELDVKIDTVDQGKCELKKHISLNASASFQAFIVLDGVNDADQIDWVLSIRDILGSSSLILVTSRDKQVLKTAGIPETSIYNLTGLHTPPAKTRFRFENDQFEELPASLSQLGRLKELWLHDSPKMKCLYGSSTSPGSYGLLNRSTELNIVDCGIISLTEDLVKMNQLKVFRVYNCPLGELLFRKDGDPVIFLREARLLGGSIRTSPEAVCPKLKHLWVNSCKYLEKVGSLPKTLITVDLSYCSRLNEIKGLCYLARLEQLDISGCEEVKKLPCLGALGSLKSLKGSGCYKLKSINGLADLSALTILDLSYCKRLSEIKGLRDLAKLEQLDISGCEELEELPSLQKLKSLEKLKASKCYKLKSINGLSDLKRLQRLHVRDCREIPVLQGVECCSSLKVLDARDCPKLKWAHRVLDGLRQHSQVFVTDDS